MGVRNQLKIIGLATAMAWPSMASAQELDWTHFGIRPLGMGNAYVAVADDYNALFYNPAGLARLKEWDGEFLNPTFQISDSTVSFLNDLSDLASGSAGEVDGVLDILEENTGKSHHFALKLTPHLIFPGFGLGAGIELSTTMAVHREISADLDFGPRAIIPISYAFNTFEDRLSIGMTVKAVLRGGVNSEFSINDIQAFASSDSDEVAEEDKPKLEDYIEGGAGAGFDVGMLFTPIETMRPTLGISITDLGGTAYKKFDIGEESLGAPDVRLPSVNTGISLVPWEQNNMFLRASADAHAINQPVHYSKKFNMGLEWGYGKIIKVQTGLHQGELTAGFDFDVFLFSCRFVTYAEQLGPVAGLDDNLRDRRYAFQLKLLF